MKNIEIGKYVMPIVYLIAGIVLIVGMIFIAIRAGAVFLAEKDLEYWEWAYFEGWLGQLIISVFVGMILLTAYKNIF